MGIVFKDVATCFATMKKLNSNGLFVLFSGNNKRVLEFIPPLITTLEEAQEIISILKTSLAAVNRFHIGIVKLAIKKFESEKKQV